MRRRLLLLLLASAALVGCDVHYQDGFGWHGFVDGYDPHVRWTLGVYEDDGVISLEIFTTEP